jgi:hypothetical protein
VNLLDTQQLGDMRRRLFQPAHVALAIALAQPVVAQADEPFGGFATH